MKDNFSATPPHIKFRCGDILMKNRIRQKINFIKIFLPICAAALLSACDLFQETPKDFLEDYGNIANVAKTEFSTEVVPQGAWHNIGSSGDVTINYIIENPGDHRLRAEVTFPNEIALSEVSIVFPENDGLLRSWTEVVDDGAGSTTRTENETNFLTSTFSITFPQSLLDTIDGNISQFDISPTVMLYRTDFGAEERPQSSHTIRLLCNTPPEKISNAVGEKIVADENETLVLAIELPALKMDDKSLTVEENGRKHVFDLPISDGAKSSDGLWTISSAAPAGIEAATYDEDGKPIMLDSADCYITTDIDIKELAPFNIALTLTDEGGLTSQYSFTSHGRKLDAPYPTSAATLEQDESDGMAAYTLQATDGATIHYTVTQTSPVGGAYSDSGSGESSLEIKLPAGTFTIEAHAEKEGFVKSDDFTESVTVNPSVFFVRAEGDDASGNGSKSVPFATIKKAVDSFMSFALAPTSAKIFILDDIYIGDGDAVSITGMNLTLRGCKDGNVGSRVTISCALTSGSLFDIGGSASMLDLDISQTTDSIASGGVDKAISVSNGGTLNMENVSISGMKVSSSGILVESGGTLNLKNVSINGNTTSGGALRLEGDLNILGDVKITGNTAASGGSLNLYLPDGKTLAINSGSLSGTQIGISTRTDPTQVAPVIITSGHYGGSDTLGAYISDKDYALKLNASNEVQLTLSGGSGTITPNPPATLTFSLSIANMSDGIEFTISASDGANAIAASDIIWALEIYQGSVSTGIRSNSNIIKIPSSYSAGTYVIKINARYSGQPYSDELNYKKT